MPILELQRRLREIGRIRLGEAVPTKTKSGKETKRPAKLDAFRLTSRDKSVIEAAALRYGGMVTTWDSPDGEQWQVKTTTRDMPVVVPPTEMAFTQWYEIWSAGGCKRRCDGQWDIIGDQACVCDPTDRECAIHTRLSVILPDLPGFGVWRVESSGYYAAVEISGVVDVLARAAADGRLLPARLRLEQRSVKRAAQTMRFAVPVLDVDLSIATLMTPTARDELATPGFTPIPVDELPAAPSPSVAEQVADTDEPSPPRKRSNAQIPIPATGLAPRTAMEAAAEENSQPEGSVGDETSATPASPSPPAEPSPTDEPPWPTYEQDYHRLYQTLEQLRGTPGQASFKDWRKECGYELPPRDPIECEMLRQRAQTLVDEQASQ